LGQDLPLVDYKLHVAQNCGTHTDVPQRYPKAPGLRILELKSVMVADPRIGNKKRNLQGFDRLPVACAGTANRYKRDQGTCYRRECRDRGRHADDLIGC